MSVLSTEYTNPAGRKAKLADKFLSLYGVAPTVAVRAPGRVDLMGSHTDYNDGCVLTLSIDRDIWIFAHPRQDGQIHVTSMNINTNVVLDTTNPDEADVPDWGIYMQGVAVELQKAGHPLTGCDAVIHGTVPLSSGLSSSAALEAASATLFEILGGYSLDKVEKTRLTQRAENNWVGVNCGILDQYSSILGEKSKALILDCRSLTHRYANFPEDLRVVICNTRAPRNLSGSEYGDRRSQCEEGATFFSQLNPDILALRDVSLELFEQQEHELSEEVARRCRFVIEENARVSALANALEHDDRPALAELTAASYEGARDLFEISVPAMDAMMKSMSAAPGCVGSRQAGAGFGGCMVAIVEKNKVDEFCKVTAANYESMSNLVPEIYPIHTAHGAGVLTDYF